MFQIQITHVPSIRLGVEGPEALAEPLIFGGFRTRTGRRAQSLYGCAPEVTYANARRRPAQWATREAANQNVTRLADRGYTAIVKEV